MQPVNAAIPAAQGIQPMGTTKSLVLCGRSVTNCCAHASFIAGYGLAFTGVGIAVWYQSIIVGVFSAIVAVPIGISQCFWSRYSNVANAAEDVDQAARGVREAAASVGAAATTILQSSGNITRAAGYVEQAAGHVQVVVDGEHLASLEANTREYKESSEVMARENAILKEQVEELKGMISPLMALVASFRASLTELKIGIKAGTPLLDSFTKLERRLDSVARSLVSEVQATTSSIQSMIEEAAQIAIATMQIIQQKNRDLSDILHDASSSLQAAVAQTSELSERISRQEAERNTHIARIEAVQRENAALQVRLGESLIAVEAQRRGYEQEAAGCIGSSSTSLGAVEGERERLTELIALIQEVKRSLPILSAEGTI
jgi:chromosome segregation ATPase